MSIMAVRKEELIREYAKAIREGNAAIFGGAGLSRPSGFVDWKGLLRPLASDIGLDVDKETDMLSVAQFYKNQRRTRAGINQAILDAFSVDAQINETSGLFHDYQYSHIGQRTMMSCWKKVFEKQTEILMSNRNLTNSQT